MYDVIIIGAGVIGASIARSLSRYNLNTLVLEKENDVGNGASCANSAIIHSGYDPKPGSKKAYFNVLGNKMFDEICNDLDVEFERIGSLTLALDEEEMNTLFSLKERAKENNVDVEIYNKEELIKIEPNVTNDAIGALYAPTAGIINPFEYVVAVMENAIDNGVLLHLNEEVTSINRLSNNTFNVTTSSNTYNTKWIINASGVYSDKVSEMVNDKFFTITPRRGEYHVLDHFNNEYCKHVLFNLPTKKGKGVLVSPTTHYNYLVGPSSELIDDTSSVKTSNEVLKEVVSNAYRLVNNVPLNNKIRSFAGIRAVGIKDNGSDDFIIEETSKCFINVAGIQSPGFASSPAIAEYVVSLLKLDESLKKDNYNPKRRPLIRFNKLSVEEQNTIIKNDPSFGKIVCRCENITEGEVIDAINRSCGATTIKGVKKRVRPGFGKCQGGFCESLVVDILARELNINKTDIVKRNKDSYILTNINKGAHYE